MALKLDQLVYTSFPEVGFQALTSPQVLPDIQQAFLQSVVQQHWNAYNPPPPGFRAAYLHQISPQQTLFGWLYTDGVDDLGRGHVPHFLCYGLTQALTSTRLDIIFDCLERGPVVPVEWQRGAKALERVVVPETCDYRPVHFGVTISSSLRAHNHLLLDQQTLLNFFVSVVPQNNSQESNEQLEPIDVCHLASTPPSVAVSGLPTEIPVNSLKSSPTLTSATDLESQPNLHSTPSELYGETTSKPQEQPTPKVALLIGVSQYGAGFEPLPGSLKDVNEMQQVLEHPDLGGFAEVQTLLNPTPQALVEAVETLYADRSKDDLILLYFSGHAVRDSRGQVCLTTTTSEWGKQDKIVRSTVVPVNFLKELMDDALSQRQVVVLDCRFSEAYLNPSSVPAIHPVNLDQQLAGSDRVILTSATSTQQDFAHKGEALSVYTFYLVEGLKTGAADHNGDGAISALEWHKYAQLRLRQAVPAMSPKLYGARAGNGIRVAQSSSHTPTFKYRKQVEKCSERGTVSPVNRIVLDTLRTKLGLDAEVAADIEVETFQPHREYKRKLQEYSLAFVGAIQQGYPVSDVLFRQLKHLQATLGLTDADIVPIETAMIRQVNAIQDPEQALTSLSLTPSLDHGSETTGGVQQPFGQVTRLAKSRTQAAVSHLEAVSRHFSYWFSTQIFRPLTLESKADRGFWSVLAHRRSWLFLGAGAVTIVMLFMAARQWFYVRSLEHAVAQLEVARTLVEQRQYEQCIGRAQAITQESKLYPNAQKLLKQCQAGVNWQNVETQTLSGHPGNTVWSVAISPDGTTLASTSYDRTIKVWDLRTEKLRHTLADHGDQVWSVAISADGKLLASGSGDTTIKLWNLESGQLVRTFAGHADTVWSVAISSDSQTLASGSSDKTIKLWDLRSGQLLRTLSGHADTVRTIAIHPSDPTLASGSSDKTIKLWDLRSGQLLRTLPNHTHRVTTIAFSPDGQTLAGSDKNGIKLWSLDSGKLLKTLSGHTEQVTAIAFNPTGKTLASGSQDKTVRVWDVQKGDPFRTFSGHLDPVYTVVFGPDQGTLASGTRDGTIRLWQRN